MEIFVIWGLTVCSITCAIVLVHLFGWLPVGLAMVVWALYSKEIEQACRAIGNARAE